MSNRLSRWWYTCIHQWRELAFHPGWNEPNQVVTLPSILNLGKEVSWTFLFHILHRCHEVPQWFGEDHLLCFCQDVLSHIDVHAPFFYAIRYSHWVLPLLPMESCSCFWRVPCWRNEVFLTRTNQQYRGRHFWIQLYPYSLFGTCFQAVQWRSTKKAIYLPVECIALFASAKRPFNLALCCVQ